jgi:hypothetical protein
MTFPFANATATRCVAMPPPPRTDGRPGRCPPRWIFFLALTP